MHDRDRLIALLIEAADKLLIESRRWSAEEQEEKLEEGYTLTFIADYLLANGVEFRGELRGGCNA